MARRVPTLERIYLEIHDRSWEALGNFLKLATRATWNTEVKALGGQGSSTFLTMLVRMSES